MNTEYSLCQNQECKDLRHDFKVSRLVVKSCEEVDKYNCVSSVVKYAVKTDNQHLRLLTWQDNPVYVGGQVHCSIVYALIS